MESPASPYEDQLEVWRNRACEFLNSDQPDLTDLSGEKRKKLL